MLAKLTSKNQLTLPKAVVESVGAPEYFEVEIRGRQVVLTPVRIQRGDAVRGKLEALGLTGEDVADAVRWSRAGEPASSVAAEPPAPPYGGAKRRTPAAPKTGSPKRR
jgi:hypothetical protein